MSLVSQLAIAALAASTGTLWLTRPVADLAPGARFADSQPPGGGSCVCQQSIGAFALFGATAALCGLLLGWCAHVQALSYAAALRRLPRTAAIVPPAAVGRLTGYSTRDS